MELGRSSWSASALLELSMVQKILGGSRLPDESGAWLFETVEVIFRSSMASNTRFSVALHVLAFLAWKDEPLKSSRIARSVGLSSLCACVDASNAVDSFRDLVPAILSQAYAEWGAKWNYLICAQFARSEAAETVQDSTRARSRSRNFCTLPAAFCGRASTMRTWRGTL